MRYILLILLAITLANSGCGEGVLKVDNSLYEPKISVYAILQPGEGVGDVFISRNFRVNERISLEELLIQDAIVTLKDVAAQQDYTLVYAPNEGTYFYPGSDLLIAPGSSYELNVSATIDGQDLQTSAVTTVPQLGMEITGLNSDSLQYRQSNSNGDLTRFSIEFERSPGIDFYLFSTYAIDGSVESYVYGNPYDDLDEEDVREDLGALRFEYEWYLNLPKTPGRSEIELFWIEMPFYGRYQVIGYACDENYENYIKTYDDVQEDDGNFHAPVLNLVGDGIGVFGAVITDTTYVVVTEN